LLSALFFGIPGLENIRSATAQTAAPPLKVLVTSNDPLSLSTTFALPSIGAVNDARNFAFVDSPRMALFLRRAGAPAPVRIFQSGEPIPGVPLSRADLIQNPKINQAGLVGFLIDYFDVGMAAMAGGIFTYDGTSFAKVVLGTDRAPGSGGAMFGRSLGFSGLNDAGDVAFTAPLIPVGSPTGTLANTTIYIARARGAAVLRIAGPGDEAPGTGGGSISFPVQGLPSPNPIGVLGFNNRGEVLFRAAITGGSGGFGVFVGWADGVRKIVAHGDPNPAGGTFDISASALIPGARLNNAGQVVLGTGSTVLVSSPGEELAVAVSLDTPVPPPLDTRKLSSISLAGFNDSGDMLLQATLTGTSTNNSVLFHYTAGNPLEIVAYKGQQAPGAPAGQTFNSFNLGGTPFNNAGDAIFFSTLNPTPSTFRGYFKKVSGGAVVRVALNGEVTPAGGTYNVSSPWALLLADGSVYYESNILGGAPTYAVFLATAIGTHVLVTDADPLPLPANVVLRPFYTSGAGTYVGFRGRYTGGQDAFIVHNVARDATSTVAKPGDPSPLPSGAPFTSVAGNAVYLNANGEVVFSGTVAGVTHLFVWSAARGVQKLVGPGDPVPDTTLTFTACTLPGHLFSQINSAGQVAFKGTYAGGTGLFVVAAGGTPVKVVWPGDTAATGETFTSTFGNFLINDAGLVAFSATTSAGTIGLFVATPGSVPVKVVATGEMEPGGGTFSTLTSPAPAGFNAAGVVTFYATLNGGSGVGLFAGMAGDAVQVIALNGTKSPAGGNFAFTAESKDVRINDAGDIFFQAALEGGSADSGYFLRRGSTGLTEAVALQGQIASGTSYPLATIPPTINGHPGEHSALGPTGEVFFNNAVDVGGGRRVIGLFLYRGLGTLEMLLMRGDPAPDSGGGIAGPASQGVGGGAPGLFFFSMNVVDGAFIDGIYAVDTRPPAVSATANPPVLTPPNGQLRPVTISGSAAGDGSCVAGTMGTYEVVDEYGLVEPHGTFTVGASGAFSFVVTLEASRRGSDTDGRLYSVRVTVRDVCGSAKTATVNIVVPRVGRK
jgi:hypothetical protein